MKKSSKKDALKKTRSGYKRIIRENMEKRYDAVEMFCLIINHLLSTKSLAWNIIGFKDWISYCIWKRKVNNTQLTKKSLSIYEKKKNLTTNQAILKKRNLLFYLM